MSNCDAPFRMAELPDLIDKEAMLAITSGRASKMIRRTPIGAVTLSRTRPSSRQVFNVVLPTSFAPLPLRYSALQSFLFGAKLLRDF